MNELTHLDLFSGIGGFAIAAQACGFRTVAFCECEPYCQQVLIEKFGAVLANSETGQPRQQETGHGRKNPGRGSSPILHSDIFTLDGTLYRGVDLLTGGFPCQPFSCAGKRRGASDDRALWPQMRRVIAESRPRWVLAENVPGIVTMELDNCLSDLESLGYSTGTLVIPACAVDARHRRDRVWIVANCSISGREALDLHRMGAKGEGLQLATLSGGPSLAHPASGRQRTDGSAQGNTGYADKCGEDAADARCELLQRWCRKPVQGPAQWLPEPRVGRVAHGIPARTHRLRALGNAIVPQVAQEIIRAMIQADQRKEP